MQFPIQFLICYRDVFCSRDSVEQDGSPDLSQGAIALRCAKAAKIQLAHLFGVHSLRSECTQSALKPRIDLFLYQGLGDRKLKALIEGREKLVLGLGFYTAALAIGHVLTNANFELCE